LLTLCFLCACFFAECAGGHLALHSSPTRRSSDLGLDDVVDDRAVDEHDAVALDRTVEAARCPEVDDVARAPAIDHVLGRGGRREDRKSTRLNSSHVKKSYAGFCLKKKKNADKC